MANEDVVVRIGATGAKEAAADTRSVGDAVADLGDGAQGAGDATKNASRATQDFDRDAKQLVKGLIGGVNPALTGMVDLVFDAVEGAGKLSTGLLAFTAIGVALGAVSQAIGGIVEAIAAADERAAATIERVRKAQAERGDQTRDVIKDLSAGLIDAGRFSPETQSVAFELFRDLLGQGVGRDSAVRLGSLGAAAGVLDPEQLALLAAAGKQGEKITTPEQLQAFLTQLGDTERRGLAQQLAAIQASPQAAESRQLEEFFRQFTDRRGLFSVAGARLRGVQVQGDDGEMRDVESPADIDALRRERDEIRQREAERDRLRQRGTTWDAPRLFFPGSERADEARLRELDQLDEIDRGLAGDEDARTRAPRSPAGVPRGVNTVINNITNVNQQINNVPPRSIDIEAANLTY